MSYKIVFLGTCPQYIDILAEQTYNAWKIYDQSLTLEKCIESYKEKLNIDKIPFCLVLLLCYNDGYKELCGAVTLEKTSQIDEFSELSPWISDFQELEYPNPRRLLMRALEGVSKNLGIKKLYVYTSDPSRVDWYLELGWKIIATSTRHDHLVTVMEYKIDENT